MSSLRKSAIKQARKRTSTGLALATAALAVVAGATIIFARPPASAPVAQAVSVATLTPAAVVPTAAQAPAAAESPAVAAASGAQSKDGPISVTAQDGVIRLATADFTDSTAHLYTLQSSGKTIPFFVLKSSDGVIRAALDACDVCFAAKKGYRQEGDELVCNNCGNRFPSTKINVVTGGCNPVALNRQIQGDSVIIKATDIEAGARYF